MPIVKISAQFVREAVCPPGKSKVDYYDSALKGFILEARPSGVKTFYLRYHDSHGKLRQCKIGDAAAVSYDKARQKAMRLRSEVELGGNPLEERQALRAVPTLAEFIRETYVPHIHLHRRNFQSTLSFIKCHVLPRFGAKHLDEITTNMLAEAHQDLRTKGYALAHANKIPILLKIMFNLARKKGIPGSESNPADGVVLFNRTTRRSGISVRLRPNACTRPCPGVAPPSSRASLLFCCYSDVANVSCWMHAGKTSIWSGATGAFLCPRAERPETFRSLTGLWKFFKRCPVGKGALI